MDTGNARKLVQDTFQNPFAKDRFYRFARELLNNFDDAPLVYRGNFIPAAYEPYVQTLERIGKYQDPDGKKVDLLIATLKKESSLEDARTMQRNFIAWYLNGGSAGELKDAALVAFVSPDADDWRFSLVKMEYKFSETPRGTVKAKEEFTPARRYSFLVGKNETTHTAQSRLVPIIQDELHNPNLEQLEDAFNIEKVTKEFFEQYRDLFLKVKDTLDEITAKHREIRTDFASKGISTVDFAKKLLGQIVFLYFLQKKGWFGVKRKQAWGSGSKQFLRELFEKKHSDYENCFNDILEPLFYEALRLERPDDYYSRFDCRIPFLNGGLFDPLNNYDWIDTDIHIPNDLFSNTYKTPQGDVGTGILDVFDRYNFTVKEDEPLEKEVAVDPEMLGKVFENLLEVKDRKSKGTYYTPREIVHFMCQESLITYLATEVGDDVPKAELETLVKYGEAVVQHDAMVEQRGRETRAYSYKLPEAVRKNAAVIDEKLKTIRICDPAVGSGAFPVGMMGEVVRARSALSPYLKAESGRTAYDFKRHAVQHSLYGVDIDPGAIEIAKLRLWLSLVVDEQDIRQIKPLPNLDYKIVQGNSLLRVEHTLFNQALFAKLESLKPLFFNETNARAKQAYKKSIDELIRQITSDKQVFDFEIYFSEVFHEKKGFDVVIANPPYVKEDTNKSAFDGLRDTECYQGKMDLWYLFGCKGLDLLRPKAVMCFIATNNWISNDGASKFRNKVMRSGRLVDFVDFGNYKVFTAGIQTMVYVMTREAEPSRYTVNYGRLLNDAADSATVSAFLGSRAPGATPDFERYAVDLSRPDFVDTYITFIPPAINKCVEKIKAVGSFRLRDDEVFSGIDVMQDSVSKAGAEKLGGKVLAGAGVFVISKKEKAERKWNEKELGIIKPYYTTKEINRYLAKPQNQFWVLYTSARTNESITAYPNIKKHLDQFQKIITSVNKPYGLHRTREERIFLGDKILAVRKCAQPSFAYVDFPCYVARTFMLIKSDRVNLKFLVAILNSRLVEFWLLEKGKRQGDAFQVDKVPLLAIPVKVGTRPEQDVVIGVVDRILEATTSEGYLNDARKRAMVRDYEQQIDELVFGLYGMTDDEVKIIDGALQSLGAVKG